MHEFEMGPGSSGAVCTAMVTDAEGFGDSCGMPPMHEVHGNLPDPATFDVVWRSPRSPQVLDREGPMTYGEAVKLANRSRAAGSIALADVEPHVPALTVERDCTHGDGCPVHPDTHAVHNFDGPNRPDFNDDFNEVMEAEALDGSQPEARTCMRMDGEHATHGYARYGQGCYILALAHTPAEVRTGTPDTMAAIGAEVATLRAEIEDGWHAQGGAELAHVMARLDRIAAWAPERATTAADLPLWLHVNCGGTFASHSVPKLIICRECDVLTGEADWRALYVQAGR